MNITVQNLSIAISGVVILDDVSFQIPDQSFTCLIGPNGSGKSTLVRALAGDLDEYSGVISKVKVNELSYLPQNLAVPPFLSVSEVVQTGFYGHSLSNKDKQLATAELLVRCGVDNISGLRFADASAGEQQRAWLAFSLAQSKDLVIMDEPLSSVDLASRKAFYQLLRGMSGNGKTLVIVTHDVDMAMNYSHRIICLDGGHKVFEGDPSLFQGFPS